MTRRVFVSDIHMTQGESLGKPEEYEWFDKQDADNFLSFLKFFQTYEFDELILLGDIMDDWLYPIVKTPPSYEQIASAVHVSPILAALKELAADKTVTYVQGNHDMSIMDDEVQNFRAAYFPGIKFQKTYQTADGIFAQHGHQYLMWNAEDPTHHKVPLGYYITRLQASVYACTDLMTCTIPEVVRTLHESGLLEDRLVDAPVNFLAGKLRDVLGNVSDATPIADTAGMPQLSIGDVKTTYADLPDAWDNLPADVGPWKSVWYEVSGLWEVACKIAFEDKTKVVLFGHTHDEDICALETIPGPYGTIPAERYGIYANCGSWSDNNDPKKRPYSYVVTEYDEVTGKHSVTLNHWNDPHHSNPIKPPVEI